MVVDAGLAHRVEQVQRGHGVVAEVFGGLAHRLADQRAGREVHHGFHLVRREHLAQAVLVAEVAALEWPPLHRPVVSLREVVEDDRGVAALREKLRGMAADVAGSAGDEDAHEEILSVPELGTC